MDLHDCFCGGKPKIDRTKCIITCQKCGVQAKSETLDFAAYRWNQRTEPAIKKAWQECKKKKAAGMGAEDGQSGAKKASTKSNRARSKKG